ncbi:GnsA/GnsB family transcriptional regulator [Escherichia coli]|nr:GnsA/GnsB family transcriptional regulator [Escherichia coli]CTU37631.1 GnsA/GnsB family transcriptional regulator [Escherichia coli]STJ97023.1 GnsA/GnsB family transcriptional regulator [Escherichia coli]
MFAGKKSAQIREILISESAWEEMTCLFAPSLKTKAEADISEYITKKIIELKKKTGKEVTSIQFTAREKMTGLESYDVKINLI